MKYNNQYTHIVPDQITFEETADGFLRCKARVLKTCVMPYSSEEVPNLPEGFSDDVLNMYVPADALSEAEAVRSLEGAPVVDWDHTWTTPDNAKHVAKGNVAGTPIVDGQFLVCDLLITDPQTIKDIKKGDIGEISAAYHADTVFEAGEHEGNPYGARQETLRYNHIAIIPAGHGRAGAEVRIFNKHSHIDKGEKTMPDEKVLVRVRLRNTKKIVNMDEEGAKAYEEEMENMDEADTASGAKLEDVMGELEAKNSELEVLTGETEELKGELSVYKEKLDDLLGDESGMVEAAAENMMEEQGEAGEILENMEMLNEDDTPMDEEKATEFANSVKKLRGEKLHTAILNAVGVKCDDLSADGKRGAFKAQNQIAKKGIGKVVAGARMQNSMIPGQLKVAAPVQRTAHERLGFKKKT